MPCWTGFCDYNKRKVLMLAEAGYNKPDNAWAVAIRPSAGMVYPLNFGSGEDTFGEWDKMTPLTDEQFSIRRFRLAGGEDIKLYCKLVKFRPGPAASFSLYEDSRGLRWLDIAINDQSYLIPSSDSSFEQQVAEELLTLGFNKYSG